MISKTAYHVRDTSTRLVNQHDMHEDLRFLTLAHAAELLRSRKLSPAELMDAFLKRITLSIRSNAYLTGRRPRTPPRPRSLGQDRARDLPLAAPRRVAQGQLRHRRHPHDRAALQAPRAQGPHARRRRRAQALRRTAAGAPGLTRDARRQAQRCSPSRSSTRCPKPRPILPEIGDQVSAKLKTHCRGGLARERSLRQTRRRVARGSGGTSDRSSGSYTSTRADSGVRMRRVDAGMP